MKKWLMQLVESGFLPTDDANLRLKKIALTLVPLIIGPAAFIWGSIYFFLDHPLSASIPMSYSIISGISLVYFFKTKKTWFIQNSQLILVLLLPFLLMWSLGGFAAGSMVMIWAIFSPIAALMFLESRAALLWFLAYFCLILLSGLIDGFVSEKVVLLPELAINIFFLLNMGFGSAGLYLLVSYSINEEKRVAEILISSRKEAERANKAKSYFLSSMSHELRTPMNAILGFGQLLEMNAEELNDDQRESVKEIMNAGYHLLNLINEVLDLAKIESGKIDVAMEVVHVSDLLQQSIDLMRTQAEERHLQFIDHVSSKDYSVQADPIRLKQALLNLLSNAVKYNRQNGQITIDAEIIDKQRLRISIKDTGEGLEKDDIEKLFIPFERLNSSSNVEGTGIGLVITKHLIELMGGCIGVESVQGEGSTFWVELELTRSGM